MLEKCLILRIFSLVSATEMRKKTPQLKVKNFQGDTHYASSESRF